MQWIFCWYVRFVAWCIWRVCPRVAIDLLYDMKQIGSLRRLSGKFLGQILKVRDIDTMLTEKERCSFWSYAIMTARVSRDNEQRPTSLIDMVMKCLARDSRHIREIVRTAIAGERWFEYVEPGSFDPSLNDWEYVVDYVLSLTTPCVANETIIAIAEEAGITLTFTAFRTRALRLLECLKADPNHKKFYLTQAVASAAFGDEIDPVAVGKCLEAGIQEGMIDDTCLLARSYGVSVNKSSLMSATEILLERGLIDEAMVAIRESGAAMNALTLREWAVDHAKKGNANAAMKLLLAAEQYAQREATQASANH